MRYFTLVLFIYIANIGLSQVSSFPYSESYEVVFTTGTDVSFISNWTGNEVASSNRIFQGTDARTGTSSLNVIPISSFDGELLLSLDLTGISNPRVRFFAFSKENGGASTRPALVSVATSIDGGSNFLDNVSIGDNSTFPNDNSTSFSQYTYDLPATASNESNVIVRITVTRGSGSGSAAELVIDDFTIEEQTVPLAISSVSASSATSILITFNQEVTQATAEVATNYTINNNITVSNAVRNGTNQVTLTTSSMPNNNYQISVNNVRDAATGTPASNLQENFSFVTPLSISSTNIVDKNTIELFFNLNLEEVSAETLSNYSINNGIGNPASAVLDPNDNQKVTLTLASDLTNNTYDITVNAVTDVSTLTSSVNLVSSMAYLPLEISSLSSLSNTQIQVTFNQEVGTAQANTTTNYELDFTFGNPNSASQDEGNAAIVVLTYGSSLVNNTYTLTVNNLSNLSGNASASNLQSSFSNSTTTNSRQIVINEIFADPTGSAPPIPQVLPLNTNDEFVELYNVSSQSIDIGSFDLTGGTVGPFVLHPGNYVILTSPNNVADFQPFGDVVAVSSWNTLTNGGEQLILRDNLGNLIDSLTYDLNWYNNATKSDGAWSLEQINPELLCSDDNNWSASTDVGGGSPGTQNSIYDITPDTTGPDLISVTPNSSQEILVLFNEIMDQARLSSALYTLNNGLTITSVSISSPYAVTLTIDTPMTSGSIYSLVVSDVFDCAGNPIVNDSQPYLYDVEAPTFQRFVFRDTVTIEVLFDEEVGRNSAENTANYAIDQSIGAPNSATLDPNDSIRIILGLTNSLSLGSSYSLSHQSLADTLGNSSGNVNSAFTFINEIDTVVVISSQLLDVYFDQDLDQTTTETLASYTVDRSIGHPITASLDNGNAKLVHLVFDNSFVQNRNQVISFDDIRASTNSLLQLLNTTFVYDTDDPDIDSVVVVDGEHLQIYFDEVLDQTSAEAVNNYSVNNSVGSPSSVTLQPGNSSVVLEFAVSFVQELEHTVTITGIEDPSGNAISNNRNYNFIHDRLAPRLIGILVLSPTTVLVEFSEVVDQTVAENTNNYFVDNEIGNPTTAVQSSENMNEVLLTFNSLGNNAINTLTISNISDVFANGLPVDLIATFVTNTALFGSLTIVSDTSLQFQFNKYLIQASAESINNFGFDNGVGLKSISQDQDDASIINMTLNISLVEGVNYRIVAQNLVDLDGNTSEAISHDFQYDPLIMSIGILSPNSLLITFKKDVDETTAERVSNFSIDGNIGNPLTAVRNNSLNNEVTLFFDTALTEGTNYVLNIQNLLDTFGQSISGSNNSIIYDASAPFIVAVNSTFSNEIEVVFNETVDHVTAQTLNHYTLNNGLGNPSSAIRSAINPNIVVLQFASDLVGGTNYQLTVDRVEDSQGKAISNATFNFSFQAIVDPGFRDLVINEVYFDTDLDAVIPNIEYIELYNRSGSSYELRGLSIGDSRDTTTLTAFTLAPGAYLIVTSLAGESNFSSYGDALGISNFPSLSNAGETIRILDRSSVVIDSLSFDVNYYNDVTKQDGGYSVELINPNKPCYDITNYAASTNVNGGTPGVINSVFDNTIDTTAPVVATLTVNSTTELELTFNESMDISTLIPSNFTLQGEVTVSSIDIQGIFAQRIILNLNIGFQTGISRILTINNVADCTGNAISNGQYSFFIGAAPCLHDLLVTEIMATPGPSNGLPETEYIELYNPTSTILALEGVILSDDKGSTTLGEYNLNPDSYLVLSRNNGVSALSNYGDVLGVNSFPTLTITDRIKIESASNELVFEINYDRSFYNDITKDDGGFSIEMINLESVCFDKANWTASLNVDGGTPGTQNSVFDLTPDSTAPQISSIEVISDIQIKVTFNESMDVATLLSQNFLLSDGLIISNIQIQDQFGTEILVNISGAFDRGRVYFLSLIGITDCAGNVLPTTNERFFLGAIPTFHELIITEIMADPSPVQGLPEVEFLEVYNTSNNILAIGGITLSDKTGSTTLPEQSLDPGSYLVLAPISVANQLTSYGDVLPVPGWRNLNSDRDNVTLSINNELIFEVFYTDEWYRSSQKSEGGFSLEMIDLAYPCSEELNWIASINNNGGTPGAVNSTNGNNPDIIGPSFMNALAISDNHIQLTFDEKLNIGNINVGNFTISPSLNISSVSIGTSKKSVILSTDQLQENAVYGINADNISDCSGNLIQINGRDISLIIPTAADSLDIVINEVLFNPNTGGVRFVELYNNSDNYINLKNWSLAGQKNQRLITIDNLIISPLSYKVLTKNQTILKDHYPKGQESTFIILPSMPNLSSTEGAVTLIDNLDQVIDYMDYSEEYQSILLNDLNGVALERIRPSGSSIDQNNWFSASSIDNFATPGYENSQFQLANEIPGNIIVQPATFAPDEPGRANFTTLNFSFDEPGNVVNVSIYDVKGNMVKEITRNSLVSTSGFFRWDGTNERGAKARVGYYMILFEIISPQGKVSIKKEKVAIGGRF